MKSLIFIIIFIFCGCLCFGAANELYGAPGAYICGFTGLGFILSAVILGLSHLFVYLNGEEDD